MRTSSSSNRKESLASTSSNPSSLTASSHALASVAVICKSGWSGRVRSRKVATAEILSPIAARLLLTRACLKSHSMTSCSTSLRCTRRSRTAPLASLGGGRLSSRRPRNKVATLSFRWLATNAISIPSTCTSRSKSATAATTASASSLGNAPPLTCSRCRRRASWSSLDSSSAQPFKSKSPPNVGRSRTLPTPIMRSKIQSATASGSEGGPPGRGAS
mmetsp:Transcript_1306/g.4965  ORF Transcript_1306/g.4965 Transcript_1306/m.4965 type:complete len:217 (+) Transcript_1306:3383-4033(+)